MSRLPLVRRAGDGDLLDRCAQRVGGAVDEGQRLQWLHRAAQRRAGFGIAGGREQSIAGVDHRDVAAHHRFADVAAPHLGEQARLDEHGGRVYRPAQALPAPQLSALRGKAARKGPRSSGECWPGGGPPTRRAGGRHRAAPAGSARGAWRGQDGQQGGGCPVVRCPGPRSGWPPPRQSTPCSERQAALSRPLDSRPPQRRTICATRCDDGPGGSAVHSGKGSAPLRGARRRQGGRDDPWMKHGRCPRAALALGDRNPASHLGGLRSDQRRNLAGT